MMDVQELSGSHNLSRRGKNSYNREGLSTIAAADILLIASQEGTCVHRTGASASVSDNSSTLGSARILRRELAASLQRFFMAPQHSWVVEQRQRQRKRDRKSGDCQHSTRRRHVLHG